MIVEIQIQQRAIHIQQNGVNFLPIDHQSAL
jgi:hypothetical protein